MLQHYLVYSKAPSVALTLSTAPAPLALPKTQPPAYASLTLQTHGLAMTTQRLPLQTKLVDALALAEVADPAEVAAAARRASSRPHEAHLEFVGHPDASPPLPLAPSGAEDGRAGKIITGVIFSTCRCQKQSNIIYSAVLCSAVAGSGRLKIV